MSTLDMEIKKVMRQLKGAQRQVQGLLKDHRWMAEAKKLAETQGPRVKKMLQSDLKKVKAFIERESKDIKIFGRALPSEITRLKKFVNIQKREGERLLKKVQKLAKSKGLNVGGETVTRRSPARKRTKTQTSSSSGNHTQTT